MIKICKILLLLSLVGFSCSSERFILDSDFDFSGDFRKYRSFAFMHISNSPVGATEEEILKSIVEKRFESMGYRHDDESPDLLVSYKFHYQPTRIVGFSQYHLNHWLRNSMDVANLSNREKSYERKTVYLPAGSYSVYFIDAKTNRMIWQGYSGQEKPWTHQQQLVASITRMMDQYQVVAY
ncbi:DUF4136 domain-containing protein [Marinoscillum sp.]|uniref:DUF4136 domain-containing protein n=1 Tax=Marinoscillum sp. TaxID=2024838 RepID=UPI003BA8E846